MPASRSLRYAITHISKRETYLELFAKAPSGAIAGEASTSYLWNPQAAYRIHEANPEAKILVILRDPIDRAYSHYLMAIREGWQDLPFLEALKADARITEQGFGNSRLYVPMGLYHQQVKRYLDIFDKSNVMILTFDRFVNPNPKIISVDSTN